ncbi:MAG: site-specific DNA-methyltransferase [Bifidobacteriaceae bacterium]|nr:site-specific DNA-methyltransferase [Bifidobacteriaceae bacterium]
MFCPPGGTVLDPFAGTGTTMEAAWQLGMNSAGVELDPVNQRLVRARLRAAVKGQAAALF